MHLPEGSNEEYPEQQVHQLKPRFRCLSASGATGAFGESQVRQDTPAAGLGPAELVAESEPSAGPQA